MTLEIIYRDMFYVFLYVALFVVVGHYLVLPSRNGSFSRWIRRLFGAMSLIMVYSIAFRTGGYREISWSDEAQYILGIIVFGLFNVIGPFSLRVSWQTRSSYRSEVTRLAAETTALARETEARARRTKDAAADERITHDPDGMP